MHTCKSVHPLQPTCKKVTLPASSGNSQLLYTQKAREKERERERERERESVCVGERERDRECVRKREIEIVCVRERERERPRARKRWSQRPRERERATTSVSTTLQGLLLDYDLGRPRVSQHRFERAWDFCVRVCGLVRFWGSGFGGWGSGLMEEV